MSQNSRCMTRLVHIALLVLLPFSASADETDEADEIVTGCHFANAEWGADMIDRCIKENQVTRTQVLGYPEKYKKFIDRCRRRNELGWGWVKTCVDRDIEAESALAAYPTEKAGLLNFCHAERGHRGTAAVKDCVDQASEGSNSPKKN